MKLQHFETNIQRENTYPKLVRDNYPAMLAQKTGKEIKTRILEDDLEYLDFLLKKIGEEVGELINAEGREHLAEEMADILELFESLADLNSLTWADIEKIKKEKAEQEGQFKKRILMLEKI